MLGVTAGRKARESGGGVPNPIKTGAASMHLCHAIGCRKEIAPQMFMCPGHWGNVADPIRILIWKHYRPGEEQSHNPSPAYLTAAWQAIAGVAEYDAEHGSLDPDLASEARRMANWTLMPAMNTSA